MKPITSPIDRTAFASAPFSLRERVDALLDFCKKYVQFSPVPANGGSAAARFTLRRPRRRHFDISENADRPVLCTVSEGNGHDAAISDSASAELSTAGNPATPRGFSILIADDNTVNRLLLRNQLEDRCSKITAACEGKEALHYLISERFDLVLLDLQMPGYHGLELIKKVREEHCINRDTPIVAVTAYAQTSERKNIIARGFDECLIKPILTEQLYEIVDLWKPLCPSQPNWTANKSYSGQLLEKTAHNRELAITIVNKLLDELPRQLVEIEAALDKSDFEIAREVTHKLHGSVSFCGLTALKLPAFALEQSLLDKNSSASDKYCTELKYAVQAFIEASPSTLAELSNPDMS